MHTGTTVPVPATNQVTLPAKIQSLMASPQHAPQTRFLLATVAG